MELTLKYYLSVRLKEYREFFFVYCIAYAFFLISLTENFSAAHDSITYLNDIEGKENLFHPHHLLYNALASVWLQLWGRLFTGIPSHFIIESFTAIWGAGIILVTWCFFRTRFRLNILRSAINTSLVAFSYGIWFYGANIEVYAPSVFFMLWLLYELSEEKTKPVSGNIAIIHCLAVLFHQVNIIYSLLLLFRYRYNKQWLWNYILTGIILVGGIYFYAGWFAEGKNNFKEFSEWVMGYAYGHDYWTPWNKGTLLNIFIGFAHAIIGGQFIFKAGAIGTWLREKFHGHHFEDEIFLVKDISDNTAIALLILSLLIAAGILYFIINLLFTALRKNLYSGVIKVLLPAFLLYSLFFSVWEPEILEFWILQSVIFWIILTGYLNATKTNIGLTLFLSISLFLVNYFGSIQWLKQRKYDLYFIKAEELKTITNKEDVLVLDKQWINDEYIQRFLGNRVMSWDEFLSNWPVKQSGRIIYLPEREVDSEEKEKGFSFISKEIVKLTHGQEVFIYTINGQ
jgi:uncharacterized protein YqgQ